jgi:hypothetical protein
MNENRLWYVDGRAFAEQVRRIEHRGGMLLDETIETWHLSYFRFVTARIREFDSLIAFAAMVCWTEPDPQVPVAQWASTVAIVDLAAERRSSLIAAALGDCEEAGIAALAWLAFDGPVLEAVEIQEHDRPLVAGYGPTERAIYRTVEYYYYLEVHHES